MNHLLIKSLLGLQLSFPQINYSTSFEHYFHSKQTASTKSSFSIKNDERIRIESNDVDIIFDDGIILRHENAIKIQDIPILMKVTIDGNYSIIAERLKMPVFRKHRTIDIELNLSEIPLMLRVPL